MLDNASDLQRRCQRGDADVEDLGHGQQNDDHSDAHEQPAAEGPSRGGGGSRRRAIEREGSVLLS